MAELEEKSGAFGGVSFENSEVEEVQTNTQGMEAGTIRNEKLPAKVGFWQKFKAFWLQEIDWNKEIKVELTPKQQKVEDEIKNFYIKKLHGKKYMTFYFKK